MDASRRPPGDIGAISVAVGDTQRRSPMAADRIIEVVRRVLIGEGIGGGDVSVAVVDDASIRVINARHLGHDYATDVVSFRLDDEPDGGLSAELIISGEMARNQATLHGVTPDVEFALYLVHGLLHLCGYDDRDVDAVVAMRRREGEVLRDLGIENPFRGGEQMISPPDESTRGGVPWPR